ncbi:MAG: TonB-dependent receptor, partial [Bryobacterales bacterium]|nr:TonB-dependent receptor [Bryobacterales bacterium]
HVSRVDLVGAMPKAELQDKANTVGPVLFRDASAFRIPDPGSNGMGRNMFRGPGYWNVDIGLQKMIDLSEKLRLQFRMETFNTFNQANFETPSASSGGSNRITQPRFGEVCCTAVAPNSTQNIIQTGESARVVQFALKMLF